MENYWYYYILAWTILSWIICILLNSNRLSKEIYFVIVYFPLSLIVGCRDWRVSADTITYLTNFYIVSDAPLDGFMIYRFEIGFVLLNKFVNIFINHGQIVLILCAFVTILGYGLFFYKYSQNFYLSTVLFVGFYTYFNAFVIVRQCLAMMIILWSMDALWRGKRKKFVFLTLLASSIHVSALMFLPFVVLYPLSFRKSLAVLLSGMVVFLLFSDYGPRVLGVVMPSDSVYLKYLGGKYVHQEVRIGFSILRILFCAFLGLWGYGLYKRNYDSQCSLRDENSQWLLWNVLAIMIVCIIGIMEYRLPLLHRVDAYYFSFICLLFPMLINSLKYYYRSIAYLILCVLNFIYLGRSMAVTNNFSEYRLFF